MAAATLLLYLRRIIDAAPTMSVHSRSSVDLVLVQVRLVQIPPGKNDDGSPICSIFDARELFLRNIIETFYLWKAVDSYAFDSYFNLFHTKHEIFAKDFMEEN